MLFRIDGNLDELVPALDEFTKSIEEEWGPALEEAKKKIKKIPLPIKVDLPLPDEMIVPFWKEEGHILMRVPIGIPGGNIGMKLIGRSARKKMEKNLKGYFEYKNIKAKVKHIGE